MAICCEQELGICPKCEQATIVHLARPNASETGFGCVNCHTAEKVVESCLVEDCPEKVIFFVTPGKTVPGIYSRLCEKHFALEEK